MKTTSQHQNHTKSLFSVLFLSVALAAFGASPNATAATMLYSETVINAINWESLNTYRTPLERDVNLSGDPSSALLQEWNIHGLNGAGVQDAMSFTGFSSASADYGRLRTSASATIENPFYNASNPRYAYQSSTGGVLVNPNGVPSALEVASAAASGDSLTFSNAFAATQVEFVFHISGSMDYEGDPLYAMFSQQFGVALGEDNDVLSLTKDDPAQINRTWTTKKFTLAEGENAISLSSYSAVRLNANSDNSDTLHGDVDFSNTFTLTGINLYEENGDLVTGWSVSSESGTVYPVPEPSAVLLGLAGAIGLFTRRRRAA